MSSFLVQQLVEVRAELAELKRSAVRYVEAPVTGVDAPSSTFAVTVAGQEDGASLDLAGIAAPRQFLPAAGDVVQLAVAGAQPVYQPGGIAENAVTGREIAPNSVSEEALTFQLTDFGGTTIFYGAAAPTATAIGDLWVKVIGVVDGVQQHETRRWDGDSWELLADQRVTQALLDAAAAQAQADAANQKGIDAIAAAGTAQTAADSASTAAGAAQTTANSKTATFRQTSPPSTTGRTVGDEWLDSDDGNRRYLWSGTAWVDTPLGASGISATARQLGAITTYRQATAPTSGMLVGDYWQDSDDGNKLYRYEGATPTWVPVQDTAIQTAISNAATAQATADGKMRIFVQASAPTGLTAGDVGDLWIDTDDGNRSYTWSGTAWTSRQLGNGAIQPQSLVASNVIATGTVTAGLLEAVLVLATQVIAGTPGNSRVQIDSAGVRLFKGTSTTPVVYLNAATGDATFRGIVEGAVFRTAPIGQQRIEIMSGSRTMTFFPATNGLPGTLESIDDGSGHAGMALHAGGGDTPGHGFINLTSTFADIVHTTGGANVSFVRVDGGGVGISVKAGARASFTTDQGVDFFSGATRWAQLNATGSMRGIVQFAGGSSAFTFGVDPGNINSDVYALRFISSNPGATGGFVYFSDRRLKKRIRDAEFLALDAVLATPIREFEWTETGESDMGFVAQEVPAAAQVQLSPDAPVDGVTDPLGISHDRMVLILWKAVQQLAERGTVPGRDPR